MTELDNVTEESSPRTERTSSALQEAQRKCKHPKTSKSGTNPYQKKEVCTICGKALLLEKTALGIQKEQERVKQKQQPSYQEYLEWKRSGALEPGGNWTDNGPNRASGSRHQ